MQRQASVVAITFSILVLLIAGGADLTTAALRALDARFITPVVAAERMWFTALPPPGSPVTVARPTRSQTVAQDGVPFFQMAGDDTLCDGTPTGGAVNPYRPLGSGAAIRGVAVGNTNSTPAAESLILGTAAPGRLILNSGSGNDRIRIGGATFSGARHVGMGDIHGGDGNDDIVVGTDREVFAFTGNGGFLFGFDRSAFGPIDGLTTVDFNGDGVAELVLYGPNDLVQIKTTVGGNVTLVAQGNAFGGTPGAISVAGGDYNGDGNGDLIVASGPGRAPQLRVFAGRSGLLLADTPTPVPSSFLGGLSVTATNLNGQGGDDIIIGTGPGRPGELVFLTGDGGGPPRLLLPLNNYPFGPSHMDGIIVSGTNLPPG